MDKHNVSVSDNVMKMRINRFKDQQSKGCFGSVLGVGRGICFAQVFFFADKIWDSSHGKILFC